jgi:hypothetical protein
MSPDQIRPELWIGQVEMRPRDPKAYGAAGAFVDILTWASNPSEYRAKAETIAATIDLYVVDVQSEEPLSARLARITPSEELEDMSLGLSPIRTQLSGARFINGALTPHDSVGNT